MLKRKMTNTLNKWYETPDKGVLFIKGSRGVGKSFIIEQFAKAHYDNVITINFEDNPLYKSIFSGSLDMGNLTKQITLKLQTNKLVPKKTLIFLDEVHLCERARDAAPVFMEEGRFDVIMASSLYGGNQLKFNTDIREDEHLVEMHSLDFEEFLWANGVSEQTISEVEAHFHNQSAIPIALHEEFLNLFKEYMVVGGMPEVVYNFIHKHNFKTVIKLQRAILRQYEKDIDKFLKKTDRRKVRQCLNSLPAQLVKEYKKFQYGVVEDKGNARKFESSILWLHDADMIHISFQLEDFKLPLANNARYDIFKVYYKDVGLLTGQLGAIAQQEIIDSNLNVFNSAILESAIADLLIKQGHRLYYVQKTTNLSMEFMIRYENALTAVSVNDADNTKAKAMDSLFENHDITKGIELTVNNLEVRGNLLRYPLYLIMFL